MPEDIPSSSKIRATLEELLQAAYDRGHNAGRKAGYAAALAELQAAGSAIFASTPHAGDEGLEGAHVADHQMSEPRRQQPQLSPSPAPTSRRRKKTLTPIRQEHIALVRKAGGRGLTETQYLKETGKGGVTLWKLARAGHLVKIGPYYYTPENAPQRPDLRNQGDLTETIITPRTCALEGCEVSLEGKQRNVKYCCPAHMNVAKSRRWQANNPEKNREKARRWVAVNPEKHRKGVKRWKAEQREAVREQARRWRAKNREKVLTPDGDT